MSYEGYERYLCPNGHLWEIDAHLTMYDDEKQKCPRCKEEEVWHESIDDTNGEGVGTVLVLSKESKVCEKCESLLDAIWEIPSNVSQEAKE